jgi:hypothetical protein
LDFLFYYYLKGAKWMVFCEVATQEIVQNATTPIFTAGELVGRPSTRFEELSWPAAI